MRLHFPPSLFLLAVAPIAALPVGAARADELVCVSPPYQIFDKPTCSWPKDVISQCTSLPKDSIFYQCNVYDLSIGRDQTRVDELGNQYHSAIFKYSERNSCSTGDNDAVSILGKCDTFAAYVQIFRSTNSGKCYAFVNAALLGTQLQEDSLRNSPRKIIQKVEIPGVARRITFTPSDDSAIASQAGARLVTTANKNRTALISGPSLSTLSLLELESPLTIKPENLKPNPAKIRITRGVGTSSDFLDVPLGKGNEESLNRIISQCT